jgi:hypothetical protein
VHAARAGLLGYFCHTAKDQCIDDSDCATMNGLQVCSYSKTSGIWQCTARILCPLGRHS